MSGGRARRSPAAGPAGLLWLALAVGAAVAAALAQLGLWPSPLVLGAAWGLFAPTRAWRVPGGALVGLLGYGAPLAIAALWLPLGRTADMVAAIMGFGAQGAIVWVISLLFAALMGLAGGWLGHTARQLLGRAQAPLSADAAAPGRGL